MYASDLTCFSFWWTIPLIMMVLCFFMMRGRRGAMMCGFGPRTAGERQTGASNSAREILDKRYASGEIDKVEYEEKRRALNGAENSNP